MVGLDDTERGQIVAAVVVADADVALDTDALRDALRARLSAYKVPRKSWRSPGGAADAVERQARHAPLVESGQ